LKTVQVVATYLRADGTPLQGTVSFHPPSPLVSGTSNALVSGDVVATIQPDGTITATLVACDDPSISPANFTYQVSEAFTNAQGRTYNVSLSWLASQPIDLMPVTPSSPNAGNVTYVAGPGVPSGGAAGTLLFKNSVTDYDTSWKTPTAAGVLPLSGGTMTGSVTSVGSSSSSVAEQNQVTGDTFPRWQQLASGYMSWGPGNTAGDTNLYRGGANVLKTDNSLTVLTRLGVGQDAPSVSTIAATTTTDQNAIKLTNTLAGGNTGSSSILSIAQTANSRGIGYKVGTESQNRWTMLHDGSMTWGPGGNTSPDTNLYRSAAGVLTTDTALTVGGTVSAGALYAPNVAPYCYGYKAWTCDPITANNATPGSGNVFLTQFVLSVPGVITTVYVPVIAAGTVTAGKNFIGIYNSAGTLISNAVSLDSVVTSTGLKAVAITVNSGATLAAGLYYVGFLLTGTVPTLLENSNTNANMVPSGGPRYGFISAQTTLPASFTPGSVGTSGGTWYFGVA
jgi:hypothetical protein